MDKENKRFCRITRSHVMDDPVVDGVILLLGALYLSLLEISIHLFGTHSEIHAGMHDNHQEDHDGENNEFNFPQHGKS